MIMLKIPVPEANEMTDLRDRWIGFKELTFLKNCQILADIRQATNWYI